MTTPAAETILTLQELRNAAEQLARAAIAAGGVTEGEIDTRRPGGSEYPDCSAGAWLAYHGWLAMRVGGGQRQDSTRKLAQVKLDAATDAPLAVQLECGETVWVQPKSAHAIIYMRALDAEMRRIGPEVAAALDGDDPVSAAVHAAVWGAVLQSKSLLFWIWAAIDGIDLPFDERSPDAEPPAITRQVRARDLLRLMEAHHQINQDDLEILVRQFPPRTDEGTPRSLADVLAALANERGVASPTLFTSASLRGLYHQALAATQLAEDARRRAVSARGRD